MAQDDFTNVMSVKERNRLQAQLNSQYEKLDAIKKARVQPSTKGIRSNTKVQEETLSGLYQRTVMEINKLERQLQTPPAQRLNAQDKNIATGLSLSGSRPRPPRPPRDPMGGMGEPDNQNFKRGIPSSRTATETSQLKNKKQSEDGQPPARNNAKQKLINLKGTLAKSNTSYPQTRRLLKRQAEDRLDNPELGYKQFGGLEIGDEEPLAQKTDRSRFRGSASDGEGTSPTDANMNALEKLVSRIIGKEIRFEDIPEDDPFITDMPQNYQNLRRGGQVKRMGHGGAITPEQKKRISRIVQENKARKSKSTKATPATSKKRAAPFSDMKKARMNGNKKRTNR
tara:strand:+ start:681 stop:1700 length:1020 start_codon:yes stop_codon:yes gene_type:complete